MSAPDRSYKLPPDLTVEDMPGDDAIRRAMNHSLYRRGLLSPAAAPPHSEAAGGARRGRARLKEED